MKRILILAFLLCLMILNAHSQSGGLTINDSVVIINQKNTVKDTVPKVVYIKRQFSEKKPAYYINGQLVNEHVLKTINPKYIDSINIVKKEIVIENTKYFGQIFIKIKKDYSLKLISLNDLKKKYLDIDKIPTIFMLDNEIIQNDYDKYFIDENYILKIIVERIDNKEESLRYNLIRLLTRTKDNIIIDREIRIRGKESKMSDFIPDINQ
jgi:hypothetical protein